MYSDQWRNEQEEGKDENGLRGWPSKVKVTNDEDTDGCGDDDDDDNNGDEQEKEEEEDDDDENKDVVVVVVVVVLDDDDEVVDIVSNGTGDDGTINSIDDLLFMISFKSSWSWHSLWWWNSLGKIKPLWLLIDDLTEKEEKITCFTWFKLFMLFWWHQCQSSRELLLVVTERKV